MAKSYVIESVDATTKTMVVAFTEDDRTTRLNLPLPEIGTSVDDQVNRYWPSPAASDVDIDAVTALIGKTTTPQETPPSLDQIKQQQIAAISDGMNTTLAGGAKSDALGPGGAEFTYPVTLVAQLNMIASVTDAIRTPPNWTANRDYAVGDSIGSEGGRLLCTVAGASGDTAPTGPGPDGSVTWEAWSTPFACADANGVWAMRPHDAEQIQQAGADTKTFVQSVQIKFSELSGRVAAAEDADSVKAVTWQFP